MSSDSISIQVGMLFCKSVSIFGFAENPAEPPLVRRAKRSIDLGIRSEDLYVEVLVVADTKMKHYHGSYLEEYIVTLMSIVSPDCIA